MTYDTTTPEGQEQRIKEIVGEHKNKSKQVMDYHWRIANSWTGEGDYTEKDHGTHWSD